MTRLTQRSATLFVSLGLMFLAWGGLPLLAQAQAPTEFQQEEGIAFEFGEVKPEHLEPAQRQRPAVNVALFAAPSLMFVAILFALIWLLRRNRDPATTQWTTVDLGRLPDSAKVLITLPLVIYGFVHLLALFTAYLQTQVDWASTEEYFFYMKLSKLSAMSHVHLFGHATMYTLVGLSFLLTRVPEKLKIAVLAIPVVSAPLDVYSWWLMKFISARFEFISMVSGMLFSLGFLTMAVITFYEVWLRDPLDRRKAQRGGLS